MRALVIVALVALGLLACKTPMHAASSRAATPDVSRAAPDPPRPGMPDVSRLDDEKLWHVINGVYLAFVDGKKRGVKLAPSGGNRKGSNVALALVGGVDFASGTIDVDLKGNGGTHASFIGIAFAVTDVKEWEAIYFRPFNFQATDDAHRGHAVQYVAWPEHTWEALRTGSPGTYEARVQPVPDPAQWFHARLVVTPAAVRVFVDGAAEPCLTIERLRQGAHGRVALFVDSQPGAFANLELHRE